MAYTINRIKFSLVLKNRKDDFMNLAKLSANGQIVMSNASAKAIRKAQAAFTGAAEEMGVFSEDDIQALVDEVRYGKES